MTSDDFMSRVDEDTEQGNNEDDFDDSNEPQSKRFRADHENSNDYDASSNQDTSPWENPPPNFNSNGAQNNNNNNQKGGRSGGAGRRQGSRWSSSNRR